jgi:hypothetical protein
VANDRGAFFHRIFYASRAVAYDQPAAVSLAATISQYFIGGPAQRLLAAR